MYDYIEVDKYTAVQIKDGGKYGFSLVEGYVNNGGCFTSSSCKRRFGRGEEKAAPVCVKLGPRDMAIATLKLLLCQIEEG